MGILSDRRRCVWQWDLDAPPEQLGPGWRRLQIRVAASRWSGENPFAARLADLSEGSDIVMSDAVRGDPGAPA
jgi:hypothetical protein